MINKYIFTTLILFFLTNQNLLGEFSTKNLVINNELKNELKNSYIMGSGFKVICRHIFDASEKIEFDHPADPKNVLSGDLVYTSSGNIVNFFNNIHPQIKNPYILITSQTDASSPGMVGGFGYGIYANKEIIDRSLNYLNDEKLIAWFGIHPDIIHPKFVPIPCGIRYFYSQKFIEVFDKVINKNKNNPPVKNKLLYMNFTIANAPVYRQLVYDYFSKQSFCTNLIFNRMPYIDEIFLDQLSESKFVLSPHGHGIDCYRTWEILLMGSIPVVKTSILDELYEDLPVLIVKEWSEVTEKFLEEKYIEICSKKYNYEKLYMPYWINKINTFIAENQAR
ncbi:MAG: hypothetical protein P4L22_02915 [Candidatus Babeliales bacterium]|nr:hypothetical protein [Candidatus Babeliales bacterium]